MLDQRGQLHQRSLEGGNQARGLLESLLVGRITHAAGKERQVPFDFFNVGCHLAQAGRVGEGAVHDAVGPHGLGISGQLPEGAQVA